MFEGPDGGGRPVEAGQGDQLPSPSIGAWEAGCFPSGGSQPQRVPLQVPMSNGPSGSSPGKSEVKLELAFEYLMSKDRLQWVTITSPQVGLPACQAGGGQGWERGGSREGEGRSGLSVVHWEGCEAHGSS